MISIIVPVYNVEKYLDKCLNSLVNQTYKDFEVIIVNDGSPDNSQDIIDKYVRDNNNFKGYIKENGGLGDARNFGITKANGDYLIFIDSDDYVDKYLVEECMKVINKYDLIIYEYESINESNNSKEIIKNKYNEDTVYKLSNNMDIMNNIHNCAWNKCYKKSLFKDITYPKGWYEDLGTTYKLLDKANSIGFINKPLLYYIATRENSISNVIDKRIFDIFDMCKLNIEYFKDNNKFEQYKEELCILLWKNIVSVMRKLPSNANKDLTNSFIDQAYDFINFYFSKRIKINESLDGNIYEYRLLTKLYMKYKGYKV